MGLPETAKVPDAVARPLVRTHLETVRKPLDLNPIRTEGIVAMAGGEALQLLADLFAHAIQPQYEYRHRWQAGDLVMWDNRCLLHKANGDYDMSQVRDLYRVMPQGDIPV
jgi:taurine dioxygenase